MVFKEQNREGIFADTAFQETLHLLEWPKLCEQISSFSCTPQGKRRAAKLPIPDNITTTKS